MREVSNPTPPTQNEDGPVYRNDHGEQNPEIFSREPQPNLQQPHRSIRLFLLSRVNGDAPALTKARRLDDSRAGWFSTL